MRSSKEEIASHLCCPDDEKPLHLENEAFLCRECRRIYSFGDGEILELLPKKPAAPGPNVQYAANYHRLFRQTFENQPDEVPWGLDQACSPSWRLHRERQARAVLSILQREGAPLEDLILSDISGGIGDYTLVYARHFKSVLHCDLSVAALRYASARCRRAGVENVFFLRVDYFALPFRRTIDRLLCLDTLIRGKDHEKALLGQIQRALSIEGRAIVDFHHWWHNPLRRLGLLRQNFGNNRSYSRSGAEGLMRDCGIENWRLARFHQEFEPGNPFARSLSPLLPATRLVYEIASTLSGSVPSDSAALLPSANALSDSPLASPKKL